MFAIIYIRYLLLRPGVIRKVKNVFFAGSNFRAPNSKLLLKKRPNMYGLLFAMLDFLHTYFVRAVRMYIVMYMYV